MASILNKKATKDLILKYCDSYRPGWNCTRVSSQAINEIETFVKLKIREAVHKHPTIGKTFMHFD